MFLPLSVQFINYISKFLFTGLGERGPAPREPEPREPGPREPGPREIEPTEPYFHSNHSESYERVVSIQYMGSKIF